MGEYTWLIEATNGAETTTIQWEDIDPTKLNHVFKEIRDKAMKPVEAEAVEAEDEVEVKPVKTVADLGQALDETKLFGYLTNEYIKTLQEVCLHMKSMDEQCCPRLFFKAEGGSSAVRHTHEMLHYLEFHPGTALVILGSHRIAEMAVRDYERNRDIKKAYRKVALKNYTSWSTEPLW
jgi:hypothetical protein